MLCHAPRVCPMTAHRAGPEAPGVDDGTRDAATTDDPRSGQPQWRFGLGPVSLIAAALLTGVRWIDADRFEPLAALQALVPWLVVPVVLVLAFATATRWWRTVVAALALLAVHATLLAPWWIADDPVGPISEPPLTVMAANLQYGRGDAATVVDAVRARDVDVVVAIETTAGSRAALRRAGLDRLLPHAVGRTREDAGGTMIHSRYPLGDVDAPPAPSLTYDAPVARVEAPGGDVLVLGAHPMPPWPVDTGLWHAEVVALANWSARAPDNVPLVVAGDLNGTSDHPVIRRFRRSGLDDAHEVAGAGRPLTWPRAGGPLPPLLHLDHVLARDLYPVAAGMVDVPESDHAAVWARLERLGR